MVDLLTITDYTLFSLPTTTNSFSLSFSAAIRLKNGKVFDYEQISFYKLTMYVTDDCATTGPYYLEVRVNNIPEVCGFDKTVYETSTTEAGVCIYYCYRKMHIRVYIVPLLFLLLLF